MTGWRMNKRLTLVVSGVLAFVMCPRIGYAYPICAFVSSPEMILAERVANADSVALVEWVEVVGEQKPQQTEFLIKRIGKGEGVPKVGERKTLAGDRKGMPGDLHIIFGVRKKSGRIALGLTKTSERAFNYVMAVPSPKIATEKRLAYYARHLEHADEFIAKDAFIEFRNAGIEDYQRISTDLPREKLLAWTLKDNPESKRQGVYAILLGICGDKDTAS